MGHFMLGLTLVPGHNSPLIRGRQRECQNTISSVSLETSMLPQHENGSNRQKKAN